MCLWFFKQSSNMHQAFPPGWDGRLRDSHGDAGHPPILEPRQNSTLGDFLSGVSLPGPCGQSVSDKSPYHLNKGYIGVISKAINVHALSVGQVF